MNYKGQLMEKGVEFVLALVFIGICLGAGLIAMSGMTPTGTTNNYNVNQTILGLGNATSALTNFSLQLGTVGTIAAVGLIILVLVGVMALAYVFVARR